MIPPKELIELIRNDDWKAVNRQLDEGMSVDVVMSMDNESLPCTPLQQAAGFGALRVIEGLIERGANLDYCKHYGSPLYCAVSFDRVHAARFLLERGSDPNVPGPSEIEGDGRWTPLLKAVFRKNLEIVELLLQFGAEPRSVSRKGIGVVTCAAYNEDEHLVAKFVAAGAPVSGNALLCAVERENENLVQVLLGAKADPNYVAGKVELSNAVAGETPLSLAIKRLSISKSMKDTRTAMGREKGQEECLRKIIGDLLRSGADPSKQVHNRTPLSLAVLDRDVAIVRLLLASGADVSGKTYSPFVEYKDSSGDELGFYETALHSAVKNGDREVVAELLKAGADPMARDHSGVSVIELIRQSADREMTALFEQRSNARR